MRTLEQVRAFLQKQDNQGGLPSNYYRFFEMKDGEQSIIRFLPDKNQENPYAFLVEKVSHTLVINGENKSVPCLTMYGEECPICKVSSAYYKDEDKINGKKYYKKRSHIGQILVVEDPLPPDATTGMNSENQFRFISLSYQIYQAVKTEFETADIDIEPWAYKGGTNFIIRKSKQGEFSTYATSRFARKPNDLDEDTIARVENQLIDLSTLLPPHPGREKVEQMLESALTGAHFDSQSEEQKEQSPFTQKTHVTEESKTQQVTTVTNDTDTGDDDEELDFETAKILAQIRNKHRSKSE
jgi:hypothetical protein